MQSEMFASRIVSSVKRENSYTMAVSWLHFGGMLWPLCATTDHLL